VAVRRRRRSRPRAWAQSVWGPVEISDRQLRAEVNNYVAAIGLGQDLGPVVNALRDSEVERDGLLRELQRSSSASTAAVTFEQLGEALKARLQDSRALMGRHVADARKALSAAIVGRLALIPQDESGKCIIRGTLTLAGLAAGQVTTALPQNVASPTGDAQT